MSGETPSIPEIAKPDLQILLQDLAQARRDIHEERRNSDRAISAERDRAKWEIERVRVESAEKVRQLELENHALARALGRRESENELLREENAVLRHTKTTSEAVMPLEPAPGKEQLKDASSGAMQTGDVVKGRKVVMIPPASPFLGKAVPLDPPTV